MITQNKIEDKNEKFRSNLPYGFTYYDNEFVTKKNKIEALLRKIFLENAFLEVALPILDFAQTFSLTSLNKISKQNFVFKGREGEVLALRSDLSVLLIKAIANGSFGKIKKQVIKNGEGDKDNLQKFCYIQKIFQDHNWGSAHKRETLQAGAEIISSTRFLESPTKRTENLIALSLNCLTKIDEEFNTNFRPQIKIIYGDLRIINNLFLELPKNLHIEMSQALHQKNISHIKNLCKYANINKNISNILEELPMLFGDFKILDEIKILAKNFPEIISIIDETKLLNFKEIIYDFSLIHEISYYTSSVFEAYIPLTNLKIFSGGVYDNLYSEFSNSISIDNENYGASGFALDLSVILDLIN